jgi:phosphate transport system protein
MRQRFDDKLNELNQMMIGMGKLIEKAISLTAKAMAEQDVEVAEAVRKTEFEINDMEKEIESQCLMLILQQQPVARDLRTISAALKMITDMERIGDQADDIAEIVILLADKPYIIKTDHISKMADASIHMVSEAIRAYINRDVELAREVIEYDNVVDSLFLTVKAELIKLIHKNRNDIEQAIDFLMIAKYFERIGDHAENIGEWVEFSITGKHKNKNVFKK